MRWILLGLALALAAPATAEELRRLTVTGEGEVAARPDMATVTLGVVEAAPTAMDAMDAASRTAAAILIAFQQAGIAPEDMQTSDLSLDPLWSDRDQGPARITGFEASNTLRVRVRDLDRLGLVLDTVLAAGANSFRGLWFGLQDPDPMADEARRRAVADARRKAELYAAAAGVTLGPVVSISEGGSSAPVPMMREMAIAAAPVPIAEGEVSTSARVTIVWALQD